MLLFIMLIPFSLLCSQNNCNFNQIIAVLILTKISWIYFPVFTGEAVKGTTLQTFLTLDNCTTRVVPEQAKNKRLWRWGNLHVSRRDIAIWTSTLTKLCLTRRLQNGKLILFLVKLLQLQQNRAVVYAVSVTR